MKVTEIMEMATALGKNVNVDLTYNRDDKFLDIDAENHDADEAAMMKFLQTLRKESNGYSVEIYYGFEDDLEVRLMF